MEEEFTSPCAFCGKPVYNARALVSDKPVFCDSNCKREYRYKKRFKDEKEYEAAKNSGNN